MSSKKMEFLFGDRVLQLQILDILKAPVDVIVNPANGSLIHGGALALDIQNAAGKELEEQSRQLIEEYGELDSGMAVFTSAGNLPYKSVVHAVGPRMGEGDEQSKLEQAILRSLLLCETNDWSSIAFPAISTGVFKVPVSICARAFYKSITHFWDARNECSMEKIVICLTNNNFQDFFDSFREESFDESNKPITVDKTNQKDIGDDIENVGIIDISESDLDTDSNDEVNDWFK